MDQHAQMTALEIASNPAVMTGLDPSIDPSSQDGLTDAMDLRVKPGGGGRDSRETS
jgi:hypothetical protein